MSKGFPFFTSLARSALPAAILLLASLACNPAPAAGTSDWVITAPTALEDTIKELDGDLIIESGGELRLTNSTLIINCSKEGEFQILVKEGGRLLADRAIITYGKARWRYWFRVNGTLDLKDSSISGTRGQFDTGGIYLAPSSAATIARCHLFENQWYAVLVNGSSPTISDCSIDALKGGIRVENGGAPTISGNTIRGAERQAIIVLNSNPAIRNNRLLDSHQGIDLYQSKPEVSGNEIANCGAWGIQCAESADATISGNAISRCQEGMSVVSSSPKISSNVIADNAVGINTSGSAAVLTRNNITGSTAWGVYSLGGAPTLNANRFTDAAGNHNSPGDVAVVSILTIHVKGSHLESIAGAKVTIKDKSGKTVFNGSTDQTGTISGIQLYKLRIDASGEHSDTPHKVSVKYKDLSSTMEIKMDRDQDVTAKLTPATSRFIPGPGVMMAAISLSMALLLLSRRRI
jgi:parallel beta-helix repeat protein